MHVRGIELGTARAAIKYPEREDLMLLKVAAGSSIAGVYTQNAFCAAPVVLTKKHMAILSREKDIYLLVNTGNANAGTGEAGYQHALACCEALAQRAGCEPAQVLPFSTGVIGETLPVEKIIPKLDDCLQNLHPHHWQRAAQAILTTDTVPKLAEKVLQLQGRDVHICGIAKGSGMIRPNMATMLAYIATDLKIEQQQLQQILQQMNEHSFNRITVDGDTSTNDCCMLIATGQSEISLDRLNDAEKKAFIDALAEIFEQLAQAIVVDGEGATKLIEIQVEQGRDEAECLQVAYTIAHSPLVKTAFFACDPNWGRILAAVGRCGIENFDIQKVKIYLGQHCIVENGGRAGGYREEEAQKIMDQSRIRVLVKLARGDEQAKIWSCDFSYDYVRINAEYRT